MGASRREIKATAHSTWEEEYLSASSLPVALLIATGARVKMWGEFMVVT